MSTQPTSSGALSRRGFVAACAIAPIAAACARMNYVSATREGDQILVARADVDATGSALIDAPQLNFPLYVHRTGESAYTAVLTRCMHRGCTVEPSAEKLVCPCHGSEYTPQGAILKGPTELPLIKFPVAVRGDRLSILAAAGSAS